jgi:hypothetical protein
LRELLRLVWDRLQEMPETGVKAHGYWPQDPGRELRKLAVQIEVVLSKKLLDGRMTDVDMRQLPPALR